MRAKRPATGARAKAQSAAATPTRRPRRRALVDEVRDLIASDFLLKGGLAPGDLLPSEKDLAARYEVSRVTLRGAMRSLQEAGLITSRHGVGWLVIASADGLMQRLDQLSSLETFAAQSGTDLGTSDLSCERLLADDALSQALEVDLQHPVLAIRRLKTLSGVPAAWLVDFVPQGVLSFETIENEFGGSVLDILLRHPETALDYADTEIKPVGVDSDMSARLHVPVGTPALFTDSIVRSVDDRVIEWAQGWLLPEHLRFRVRRRRQIG
jgi:DNA-binding GntR family transcriptional regulator